MIGHEVAAVIAAEGIAQRGLLRGVSASTGKAVAQDALHRGEIRAGVEGICRVETESPKVALVDLAKSSASQLRMDRPR